MRTLVIGAGAVGGYFAARLVQAGFDVTVAARGEHGRVLRERGLLIRSLGSGDASAQGEEVVPLPRVVDDASTLGQRFDLILLGVKALQLEGACDALPNLVTPNGVVAPLLNGLTSEDVVARYVGAQRTISAVAYMSSGLMEPGALYVHGQVRLGLAPYRPGQEDDLARIAAMFEKASVAVQRSEDHRAMLWQKMVWNAPLNAICALAEKPAGVCIERMKPTVARAMREVIAVAAAEGTKLPEKLVDNMLDMSLKQFPMTEPSMLQDMRRGRATEVDVLQGEVVARAEQLGVDVPVLSTLAALVRTRV